jgi:hypothetical protein
MRIAKKQKEKAMTNLREDETEMEDGQRTTNTHVPTSNLSTAIAKQVS